ncbi:MASE1 domain-containing protein [Arsenophonus nasoniae]|uniref:MASE1 domain-containing protein n=2 Tax=Arsenophonus nasoniae TaxID=638 RepID=A0AA95GPU9_9GAMM|nr:MASE1 domain-containing protein [Arsenophonus nasoniae]WGM00494.1 MASE1 domain-containing protein [Arsenophonus nasoniae]
MIGLVKVSSHIRWFTFLSWTLIYFISAVISKEVQVPYDESLVVVWFPAGVSIMAFLLSPIRAWPAFLFLFSLVNWYLEPEPFDVASSMMSMVSALSLLISPLLIASIVRYLAQYQSPLNTIITWIIISAVICAIDNWLSVLLLDSLDEKIILDDFLTSWLADMSGIYFAVAMLLGLVQPQSLKQLNSIKKILLTLCWLMMLAISSWLIFSDQITGLKSYINYHYGSALNIILACIPIIFIILLILFLQDFCRGIGLLVLGTIVIFYSEQGYGPFFLPGLLREEPLLLAQTYLSVIAIFMLLLSLLAASQVERTSKRASKSLIRYQLFIQEDKIKFDPQIKLITSLPVKSDIHHILQAIEISAHEMLKEHWSLVSSHHGMPVNFQLKGLDGEWLNVRDRILITIADKINPMLLGEWEILSKSKVDL